MDQLLSLKPFARHAVVSGEEASLKPSKYFHVLLVSINVDAPASNGLRSIKYNRDVNRNIWRIVCAFEGSLSGTNVKSRVRVSP
jgi:hypothetical protein